MRCAAFCNRSKLTKVVTKKEHFVPVLARVAPEPPRPPQERLALKQVDRLLASPLLGGDDVPVDGAEQRVGDLLEVGLRGPSCGCLLLLLLDVGKGAVPERHARAPGILEAPPLSTTSKVTDNWLRKVAVHHAEARAGCVYCRDPRGPGQAQICLSQWQQCPTPAQLLQH